MHLDKSILIHAPPAEVLAWLAPQRRARWDPGLVRATGFHDGRHFDLVARAFGHRFESHAEALAFDERRFAWRQLEGDYEEHRGAYSLEPVRDGTRLRLVADVEFPYVMPAVVTEAEIKHAISGQADEALLRLKELVERGAGAS